MKTFTSRKTSRFKIKRKKIPEISNTNPPLIFLSHFFLGSYFSYKSDNAFHKTRKNKNYYGKILEKRCKVTSKTGAKMSPAIVGLNKKVSDHRRWRDRIIKMDPH